MQKCSVYWVFKSNVEQTRTSTLITTLASRSTWISTFGHGLKRNRPPLTTYIQKHLVVCQLNLTGNCGKFKLVIHHRLKDLQERCYHLKTAIFVSQTHLTRSPECNQPSSSNASIVFSLQTKHQKRSVSNKKSLKLLFKCC